MNYLTFDTETLNKDEKITFDLGFVIHDNIGKILYKNHYLIKETFENKEIMDSAFYACNIPIYLKMLEEGKITKEPFANILEHLQKIVIEYNVECICAYNLLFDLHAFLDTYKFVVYNIRKPRDENGNIIKKEKKKYDTPFFSYCKEFANTTIFKKELQYMCLYGMTVTQLLVKEEYIHLAVEQGWISDKGNIQTGAECAYRYISKNCNFMESHTALDDALIETELFKKCQEMEGEYTNEIIYAPFRLVKKRYEELYGKPA